MEHTPNAPNDEPREKDHTSEAEVPLDGTPLEQVTAYLRLAFAAADIRGEAITDDDAQAVATLLARLLGADSAMARFALTGETDPERLGAECQLLTEHDLQNPDVRAWIRHLEQYLHRRSP